MGTPGCLCAAWRGAFSRGSYCSARIWHPVFLEVALWRTMRLPAPPGAGVWAGRAAASVPGAGPSSPLPRWEINCVGWQGVLVPPRCHPWGWEEGSSRAGGTLWDRGWWQGTACGCGVPPCCKWVPAAGLWLLWVRMRGDVTARSLLGVLPLTASPWSCSSGHVLPANPLVGSCPCPFPHLWAILAKPGPIRGCRMVGPGEG